MARYKDYEDEIRDFSLLVNNQFLLALVMQEIPIIDYKVEVCTEDLIHKFGMIAFAEIRFLVANKDKYRLELRVLEEEGENFKFLAMLYYPKAFIVPKGTLTDADMDKFINDTASPGKIIEHKVPPSGIQYATEEKVFHFRPTMNQGEVIVNELSIWLKEQIALKVSGLN
jgi:hypothetical protein